MDLQEKVKLVFRSQQKTTTRNVSFVALLVLDKKVNAVEISADTIFNWKKMFVSLRKHVTQRYIM